MKLAKAIGTALVLLLSTIPCLAYSGAEMLQSGSEFGKGFVFGALSSRLEILAVDGDRQLLQRNCIDSAKIDSSSMYDAVTQFIRDNPASLAEPASVAVLKTIDAMCPAAHQLPQ